VVRRDDLVLGWTDIINKEYLRVDSKEKITFNQLVINKWWA
jgi:hypothetical protein